MRRSAAALVHIALLLAACGGGSGGTAPASPGATASALSTPTGIGCGESDFRDRALAAINERRAAGAQCGENGTFPAAGAVGWSDALAAAAYGHSREMAERGYFDPVSPEGTTPAARIAATGYGAASIGENIARGGASNAHAVVDLWMTSPDHCKNIMTARFVHAGMACAQSGGGPRHHTLDLATPR